MTSEVTQNFSSWKTIHNFVVEKSKLRNENGKKSYEIVPLLVSQKFFYYVALHQLQLLQW